MRVIGGGLRGLSFTSPKAETTHPMSEQVRGALFNILGDINGLVVLDPYAGSGSLSFEAASRGAQRVVSIEKNKRAQKTIEKNINSLGLNGTVKLIKTSVESWLSTNGDAEFDITLMDPPYDQLDEKILSRIAVRLRPGGLVALSCAGRRESPVISGFNIVKQNSYGDAQLVFYRRIT